MIANFAATGNPIGENVDGLNQWDPVESEPFKGLIIDQQLKFDVMEESERIQKTWEKFYEETGTKFC